MAALVNLVSFLFCNQNRFFLKYLLFPQKICQMQSQLEDQSKAASCK